MKRMLLTELRKMLRSRALLWAILIGMAVGVVNVAENYAMTQWFYGTEEVVYSPGYGALSIYAAWIDGTQMTVGETIFFTIFPLLAAVPFAWSMHSERRSGYTNQILTRGAKKQYFAAKYMAAFLSGGIAIVSAMVFNFMANAWILPTCKPLYIMTGGGDGMFLSRFLFTRPMVYVLLCLITCFFWAGTLACLGLTAGLFIRSAVGIVLFPFLLFLGGSFLVEGTRQSISYVTILSTLETSPLQLLHAMTLNSNPAWYVWTVLLVLLALVSAVYFLRGARDEML